jgi:DNA-binding NarL/FixJ family response regulator
MDGLQALPEISRVAPDAKIGVLSGLDGDNLIRTALELGADLYPDKGTALVELPTLLRRGRRVESVRGLHRTRLRPRQGETRGSAIPDQAP